MRQHHQLLSFHIQHEKIQLYQSTHICSPSFLLDAIFLELLFRISLLRSSWRAEALKIQGIPWHAWHSKSLPETSTSFNATDPRHRQLEAFSQHWKSSLHSRSLQETLTRETYSFPQMIPAFPAVSAKIEPFNDRFCPRTFLLLLVIHDGLYIRFLCAVPHRVFYCFS